MSTNNVDGCTDDVDKTFYSTKPPVTQAHTSERGSARRPDRPTTLSRPLQVPTCCNFRRQPWRTYVHGEFSYTAAPRCYSGVEDELGAAADNDVVVRIVESLQTTDKQLDCSNGFHGDDINKPDVSGEERILCDNGSKEHTDQTDRNDSTSQNTRKSSPEVAAVQTTTVPLSLNVKDTNCRNGILGVEEVFVNIDNQQNEKGQTNHGERSPMRQMSEDINQNLRPINGAKHPAGVAPETKSQWHTGIGNSQQRSKSPTTGRQQKSKSRRSRNRSLASRDERLANGGAERQNQHGGRKSTRSRTLSPALTERFDNHVSRRVQTDVYNPEVAQYDVTVIESSAACFRPGVHRKSRNAAASEHTVNATVVSSPANTRRFAVQISAVELIRTLLYFSGSYSV